MFYIVQGEGFRKYEHAVIYKNEIMIHDPHYKRSGLKKPELIHLLVKTNYG